MRKVEIRIDIDASPYMIIHAFTDANMLKAWWGVERLLIEKKAGGIYTLVWNIHENGFGYVSSGIVRLYEAGGTLEIDNFIYLNPSRPIFGPMQLIIRAENKGSQTELYLCQDGYQSGDDWDWYYDAVNQAWPIVLKQLKTYLENLNTQ